MDRFYCAECGGCMQIQMQNTLDGSEHKVEPTCKPETNPTRNHWGNTRESWYDYAGMTQQRTNKGETETGGERS